MEDQDFVLFHQSQSKGSQKSYSGYHNNTDRLSLRNRTRGSQEDRTARDREAVFYQLEAVLEMGEQGMEYRGCRETPDLWS